MNINYFKFLFKKKYKYLLIVLTLLLIIFPFSLMGRKFEYIFIYPSSYKIFSPDNLMFEMFCFVIFILSIVTPVAIRNHFLNKKECDVIHSLPIKRERLFITTYLFGFICVIDLWTITFLLFLLILAIKGAQINYEFMFLFALIMWAYALIFYSLTSFLTMLGTNKLDSKLILIGFFVALIFLYFLLVQFKPLRVSDNRIFVYTLIPITGMFNLSSFIAKKSVKLSIEAKTIIEEMANEPYGYSYKDYLAEFPSYYLVSLIILLVISIILLYLGYELFKKEKVERIEGITPHQIPLKIIQGIIEVGSIVPIIVFFNVPDMIIGFLFISFIHFVITFAINRKIAFNVYGFASLGGYILLGVILSIILNLS